MVGRWVFYGRWQRNQFRDWSDISAKIIELKFSCQETAFLSYSIFDEYWLGGPKGTK